MGSPRWLKYPDRLFGKVSKEPRLGNGITIVVIGLKVSFGGRIGEVRAVVDASVR